MMGIEVIVNGVGQSVGGNLWEQVKNLIDAKYVSNFDQGVSFISGETKYTIYECDSELVLSANCPYSLSHIFDSFGSEVSELLTYAGLI